MKNFIIIFLIIQSIVLHAQLENFPTHNENPIWGYYSQGGYLTSPEFHLDGLFGDTVIGSINYSKLYSSTDTIINESSIKDLLGYIRVSDKKVYFINIHINKEELLYDFSANLNDTIELNKIGDYAVVYDIDSININGKIHKRFYLENHNHGKGKWIENIGSEYGLLVNMYYATDNNPPTTTLVCFKYQDINYYPNYNCSCFDYFLNSSSTKKIPDNSFEIYPNPITYESVISFISNEPVAEVWIYNINSALIWHENLDSEIFPVGKVSLRSGIYLLSVKMKNGYYYSSKFMKP